MSLRTRRSFCKNPLFGVDELARGYVGALVPNKGSGTCIHTPVVLRALTLTLVLPFALALTSVIPVTRYTNENIQQVTQFFFNFFV